MMGEETGYYYNNGWEASVSESEAILPKGKIEFDISGNCLKINAGIEDYRMSMLEYNRVPGLANLKVEEEGERKTLMYDISSRYSLKDLLGGKTFTSEQIRNFIIGTNRMLENLGMFFLESGDILTSPEYVYAGYDLKPSFIMFPGYGRSFSDGFSELLKGLLGAVDPSDHDAVVLTYNLYQTSLERGYVIKDLMNML